MNQLTRRRAPSSQSAHQSPGRAVAATAAAASWREDGARRKHIHADPHTQCNLASKLHRSQDLGKRTNNKGQGGRDQNLKPFLSVFSLKIPSVSVRAPAIPSGKRILARNERVEVSGAVFGRLYRLAVPLESLLDEGLDELVPLRRRAFED